MGLFDTLKTPVFLKEDSDLPLYIEKLKALQEKANGQLRDKIDKEIKIATIGLKGEENVAFELKNSNMPMYILRDIHLVTDELSAQIDFIVITRKLNFIIECKNLIGDIEITQNGDFIRHYEFKGKKISEGIYSPVTQNQRHLDVLKKIKTDGKSNILTKFISERYFEDFHKSIIVLSNSKTVLNAKYAKKEIKDLVIRADGLIAYIKECCNKCKEHPSGDNEMKVIAEKLLSLHVPNATDYTEKYKELLSEFNSEDNEEAIEINAQNNVGKNVDELVQKLKAYRLQKSKEQNMKPYYVFKDDQMMELIEKMPKSKEELMDVSGFGEVKAEKYGDDIISILYES